MRRAHPALRRSRAAEHVLERVMNDYLPEILTASRAAYVKCGYWNDADVNPRPSMELMMSAVDELEGEVKKSADKIQLLLAELDVNADAGDDIYRELAQHLLIASVRHFHTLFEELGAEGAPPTTDREFLTLVFDKAAPMAKTIALEAVDRVK